MSEEGLYSIILLLFSITFPVGYIVWRFFTYVCNKRDRAIRRRVRNRMPFPSFMPRPPRPIGQMPRVQAPRQDPITVNNAQKVLILEALAKVNVENEKEEEVINTPPPTVRLIREN
jgi:hypothetical protein